MKTVFDNYQCAHIWAAQTQATGRTTTHAMSFERETIYSYQTAIARICTLADTTRLVLINSNHYSMTTSSKHMPAVHRAVNHLQSIGVPHVKAYGVTEHTANLEYLRAEYLKSIAKLERCRNVGEYEYRNLDRLASNARRYAIAFGLPAVYPPDIVQNDIRNARAFRAARDARLNTPKAIAARERAKEKRDAQRTAKQIADRAVREERSRIWKAESEARRIEDARTLPERIEMWRRGASNGYGNLHGIAPMLRVSTDGREIETSHGAQVPFKHGIRALRFILHTWSQGVGYTHSKEDEVGIGHFTLDAITHTHVRAGCHNFERSEIEAFMITTGVTAQ